MTEFLYYKYVMIFFFNSGKLESVQLHDDRNKILILVSPYFERKDIHKKDCIEELTFDSPEIVKTIGKESF